METSPASQSSGVQPGNPPESKRQALQKLAAALAVGCITALLIFWGDRARASMDVKMLTGGWFCRTTLHKGENIKIFGANEQVITVDEITIKLGGDGLGQLSWLENGKVADAAHGEWALKKDYLIIQRDKLRGGFAAFRIASRSENRLTLVNRGGLILEFTRTN